MPRFVINHPDYWYRSAKAAAESLSKVLWLGSSLALTAIVLKLLGGSEFYVQGVKIPLDYSAIPFALITVMHLFCATQFIRAARKYWEITDPKQYSELFKDITSTGGLFMRGMQPRILPDGGGPAPMGTEPATWLSYGAIIILFIACIPSAGMLSIYAAPAYIIAYANWVIGSYWAIALSELAVEKKYSTILLKSWRRGREVPTVFDEPTSDTTRSDSSAAASAEQVDDT